MIQLPFHKWTLTFLSQEYEKQYEEEQISLRLFNFRLLSICLAIICIVCLIVFFVQEQPLILILLVTALTGLCFLFLILSSRITKYIKYAFTLCFIVSVGGSVYASLNAFKIPQFVYGFNTCALGIFLLQHTDNKVKLFLICGTPVILLEMFSLYDLETLQFIVFAFCGAILIGILLYHNEYTQRECFSIKILNSKQMDIIHEYLNDPFIAISFNQRTRQFELEFMNRSLREQFTIHDTESMKEFLRNTCISKETNVFKSTDTQFKRNTLQQITTEEYLYFMMQKDTQEDNLQIHQIQKQHSHWAKNIVLKKIDYGKPVFFILIKSNQQIQDDYQKEEVFSLFKNTVTDQLQHIGRSYQQLLKEIDKIPSLNLQSMGILIFNSLKNSILYLQEDKIQVLSQDIQIIPLNKLINSLNQIFICLSKKQNKKFFNFNAVEKQFEIKLNTKFLIQILLNIFEFALNHALSSTTIIFSITEDQNLDSSQNQANKLLKLVFSFASQDKLSTPFSEQLSKKQESPFRFLGKNTHITNQLLSYLGPYGNITFDQEYQMNQTKGKYQNELYFYIYSNQLLEDSSYTKYISNRKQQ